MADPRSMLLGLMLFWTLAALIFTISAAWGGINDFAPIYFLCVAVGWPLSTWCVMRGAEPAEDAGGSGRAAMNVARLRRNQWLTGYCWLILPMLSALFMATRDAEALLEHLLAALMIWSAGLPLTLRYLFFFLSAEDEAAMARGESMLMRRLAGKWPVVIGQSLLLPLGVFALVELGTFKAGIVYLLLWLLVMAPLWKLVMENHSDDDQRSGYLLPSNSVLLSKYYVGMLWGVSVPLFIYDTLWASHEVMAKLLLAYSWILLLPISLLFIVMTQGDRRRDRVGRDWDSIRGEARRKLDKADDVSAYPRYASKFIRCGIGVDARQRKVVLLGPYGGPRVYPFEDIISASLEKSKRYYWTRKYEKYTETVHTLKVKVVDLDTPAYEIVFDESEAGEAREWQNRIDAIVELRSRSRCQCAAETG